MSATLGAALKKIATALLLDKRGRNALVTVFLAAILAVLLPVMGVAAVFKGLEKTADEPGFTEAILADLSFEDLAGATQVDNTLKEIEEAMEEAGLEEETVRAQVLYVMVLSDFADDPGFVSRLVGCFYSGITDSALAQQVNSVFGTELTGEQLSQLMEWAMPDLLSIAMAQLGNVGGEPFWRWYGFESRVEWCAIFVSWCADQSGLLSAGILPRFSVCDEGVRWFQARSRWKDNSYTPSPGDIIFFDWAFNGLDGNTDHVGIVEKVESGRVYTIEGNSGDTCRECSYPLGYYEIQGYGLLEIESEERI